MCLVFFYMNNDGKSKYKMILASNREEFLSRPTKAADFHPNHPHILSGTDLKPDVKGGTWLGVTKSGKFATLTNYMVKKIDESGLARGQLVLNYLKGEDNHLDYLKSLKGDQYRPFNLLTGGVNSNGTVEASFYSNMDDSEARALEGSVNVIGCTVINGKWKKISKGKNLFNEVITNSGQEEQDVLADKLFTEVLSNKECLYPDKEVTDQVAAVSEEYLKRYCSIMITGLPTYGTTTQTVVLVDQNNDLYFCENTLDTDGSAGKQIRNKKTYKFNLNL